jgi:hypothetical protein
MVTDAGKIKPSLLPFKKMENVISDVLHMELRVTDRFQLLLHNDLQSMDASFSINMVNNSNFKKYINPNPNPNPNQVESKTTNLLCEI